MTTRISARLEEKMSKMISSGQYADAEEVLNQAVALLESRDNRLEWIRSAIAESDAANERGEGVRYTSELMDALEAEAHERFLRGERPSPDVCP
jgi:Arc/MetJ-type ribon-helix-helix transcriptional regulator